MPGSWLWLLGSIAFNALSLYLSRPIQAAEPDPGDVQVANSREGLPILDVEGTVEIVPGVGFWQEGTPEPIRASQGKK